MRKSGQSIIEVVVSIAIAAILAVSLISTLLITQKTSHTAKNTNEATKLAQEYMEQIRIFRDRFGTDALIADTDYCTLISPDPHPSTWSLYGGPSCNDVVAVGNTNFTRWFNITDQGDSIFVKVFVQWEESGGTRAISNSSNLSDLE